MQSELKRCLHRRYTVDIAEQVGRCIDCGIEGRMQFVGSDQTVAWNTRAEGDAVTQRVQAAINSVNFEDIKARGQREYLKAGARRVIAAINAALKTSTGEGK